MENKDNSRVRSRKSRSPQLTRKSPRNGSLVKRENSKSSEGRDADAKSAFSPKTEEKKEKSFSYASTRRPNTASGSLRKKSEFGEIEQNRDPPMSRSFSIPNKNYKFDRESIESSELPLFQRKDGKDGSSNLKKKGPPKTNCPSNATEKSTSLLSQVIREQKKIIETLSAASKNRHKKAVDDVKLKTDVTGDHKSLPLGPSFSASISDETPSSCAFMNPFRSTLEEIFQAWMCLFHFIINLTRVPQFEGTENFIRNPKLEREIAIQAMECVKLYSKLKMKPMTDLLEEFQCQNDHHVNEPQITNFEEKVLSPFLAEMNFVRKKAKEILKKTNNGKTK